MQLVKPPVIESEDVERRHKAAKAYFEAIKKAGAIQSTNSMRIGWNAYRLKMENLFGMLGFADENEARDAAGVGESTWYSTIRLAESFERMDETSFIAMKLTNAKALADLPESKRYEAQWVRDASHKSLKEFAAAVDVEMQGKARASDGKERPAVLKMDMPTTRKKVVEEKIAQYALSIGIEDQGRALEIMAVEATGGTGLMEAITTSLQAIREAKAAMHGNLSADEALVAVEVKLDDIVLLFQKALDQADGKVNQQAA